MILHKVCHYSCQAVMKCMNSGVSMTILSFGENIHLWYKTKFHYGVWQLLTVQLNVNVIVTIVSKNSAGKSIGRQVHSMAGLIITHNNNLHMIFPNRVPNWSLDEYFEIFYGNEILRSRRIFVVSGAVEYSSEKPMELPIFWLFDQYCT